MKPAYLSEGRRGPAQIWNSAPQLAQIPPIATASLVPAGARVVVIAPHPGDEVLACGGLLQLLSTLEHPLKLISITDGSASHPGSQVWPAQPFERGAPPGKRRSAAPPGHAVAQLEVDTWRFL